MSSILDDARRRTLDGLADALIPAAAGKPSASEAGVSGELLDRTLAAVPAWTEPLLALLDEAEGRDPDRFARRLREERPDEFAVLSLAAAGAYFLNPQVRELIGYPGQEAHPLSLAAAPEYVENGMLERVYERSPGHRLPASATRPPPSPT